MQIEVVALMLFVSSTAQAQTIYKCGGKTETPVYQSSPCQSETLKILDASPTNEVTRVQTDPARAWHIPIAPATPVTPVAPLASVPVASTAIAQAYSD